MVVIAGFFKATWKLLYAAGVCDFVALNRAFFPMQTTGFVLTALGLVAMLCVHQGKHAAYAVAAPVVYESPMIFVALMVLGTMGMCACLSIVARRMKRPLALLCFALAFVFMLAMGYLSSRDFTEPLMNWVAQGVNILGQGALLAGAVILRKAGLASWKAEVAA